MRTTHKVLYTAQKRETKHYAKCEKCTTKLLLCKVILLAPIFIILFVATNGCDKLRNFKTDDITPITVKQAYITGNWYEIRTSYYVTYTFSKDTIYQYIENYPIADTLISTYKFISIDSIQVKRDIPEPHLRIINNKIIFYGNDSLLIEGFTPTVGHPEQQFYDVKLVKTKPL